MKVMVLGSGPERIGKTGELDRFAYRALEFLRKLNVHVVYVDSNPASMAASPAPRTTVYIEPLTLMNLQSIVERERPDGIIHSFGGRLAIHLAVFLDREGVFDQCGVRVLGTSVPSLKRLIEKEIFQKTLEDLNVPHVDEWVAHSIPECASISQSVGFPLIMRPSIALEGNGGYLVYNIDEVKQIAPLAFGQSPVRKVGIRKVEHGWVQLGLELIHDPAAPGRVHEVGTFEPLEGGMEGNMGDTPVLTPSPSFQGDLLNKAIELSCRVARELSLMGSFLMRFMYRPSDETLKVFRIVPGFSRLTALASYLGPVDLAEINVALFMGCSLSELSQQYPLPLVSEKNHCVTALRVPLESYTGDSTEMTIPSISALGAEIAVGNSPVEVMAKALCSYLTGSCTRSDTSPRVQPGHIPRRSILELMETAVGENSSGQTNRYKELNPCLDTALKKVGNTLLAMKRYNGTLPGERELINALQSGFSDDCLALLTGMALDEVKGIRRKCGLFLKSESTSRQTLQGGMQWLFRSTIKGNGKMTGTFSGTVKQRTPALLILGPGPYSVGWGPEVDQTLLKMAQALKKRGKRLVLINNNPDSPANDAHIFDGVYIERPTCDTVECVSREWGISGVIHQFCRWLPIGMAGSLAKHSIPVLGTPLDSMSLLHSIPLLWKELAEIGVPLMDFAFAHEKEDIFHETTLLGYPLLVRLTDTNVHPPTRIIYNEEMLRHFIEEYHTRCSPEHPLYMETFREGLIGAELLSVCDGNTAKLHLFLENIEEYGIHHDDCASIIPAWSISDHQVALAEEMLNRIVHRFGIVGYVRLCVVVERHKVYVTGLSPYPGRNISFFERAAGLPIHDAAAAVMIGEKSCVEDIQMSSRLRRFYVKESVFPFQRFPSMNPALSPMMASTGQVMGHDDNFGKAYIKSQVAVNPRILKEGKVFISGRDAEKEPILRVAKKLLELNFLIVSTQGTAHFLIDKGVQVEKVNKLSERRPNIIDLIKNDEISLVINIPGGFQSKQDELIIRRASIEHNIPLVTTISGALLIVKGIEELEKRPLEVIPLEQ